MDFISNQEPQIKEMLKEIGIQSIDELFCDIPDNLKLPRPEKDDGISEYEGIRHMETLAAENTFPYYESYLGAGAYEHHIPAIVSAITSKSEFLTTYTPYQAESSQGMLQSIFEFQSAICALTGMDVANASLYDAASACAEALLMALRINKKRNKVLVAKSLHPHYRYVIRQYLESFKTEIELVSFAENGQITDLQIDEETAAILVQSPNLFGVMEEVKSISEKAKAVGALTILCANPISYGLYASAADQGADIAIGDCQPLGLPLNYGGPYAGYMGCRQELVRQLPGRVVGETQDQEGKRGFVLTLQAREQHIRREKATSNICTNQALAALASLVAMLWYGKEGIRKLALTNYQRTAYLKSLLEKLPGVKSWGNVPHFNEFVVQFDQPIDDVVHRLREQGIYPGVRLDRWYPELENSLLIAVTETKSKEQLDRFAEVVAKVEG